MLKFSLSLTRNGDFRRLYSRGANSASPRIAMYCRKNGKKINRLGITVSGKIGNAVARNRIRRRLKEIYRLNESSLLSGYDLVVVARMKSRFAKYSELNEDFLKLSRKLGVHGADR